MHASAPRAGGSFLMTNKRHHAHSSKVQHRHGRMGQATQSRKGRENLGNFGRGSKAHCKAYVSYAHILAPWGSCYTQNSGSSHRPLPSARPSRWWRASAGVGVQRVLARHRRPEARQLQAEDELEDSRQLVIPGQALQSARGRRCAADEGRPWPAGNGEGGRRRGRTAGRGTAAAATCAPCTACTPPGARTCGRRRPRAAASP